MTDEASTAADTPVKSADAVELHRLVLRDRDLACARCRHNLRDCDGRLCPECGEPVMLVIAPVLLKLGPKSTAMSMWPFMSAMLAIAALVHGLIAVGAGSAIIIEFVHYALLPNELQLAIGLAHGFATVLLGAGSASIWAKSAWLTARKTSINWLLTFGVILCAVIIHRVPFILTDW